MWVAGWGGEVEWVCVPKQGEDTPDLIPATLLRR